MYDKGHLLELAEALRSNEEDDIVVGRSDAERCAEALTIVATSKRNRFTITIAAPIILLALVIAGVVGHIV